MVPTSSMCTRKDGVQVLLCRAACATSGEKRSSNESSGNKRASLLTTAAMTFGCSRRASGTSAMPDTSGLFFTQA